jgi:hypothetical protein
MSTASWPIPKNPNSPTNIQFHDASGNSVNRVPTRGTLDCANRIGELEETGPPATAAISGEPLARGMLRAAPPINTNANRAATRARPIHEGIPTFWENIQTPISTVFRAVKSHPSASSRRRKSLELVPLGIETSVVPSWKRLASRQSGCESK